MNSKRNVSVTVMLGIALAGFAQEKDCDELLLKHGGWQQEGGTEWSFRLTSSLGGRISYLGAAHEDDPNHEQFKQMRREWEALKPTIAFYEGPDRGIGENDVETITKFGESGYVRFLAAKESVKTMTLEPDFAATYQYLISRFPQNQVDIYMITKEAMRLRTRKNYSREQLEAELNKMLPMFPKMMGGGKLTISSIEELQRDFKRYWGDKLEWWQAPQEWFDPLKSSSVTGGIFTNEINAASSDYRDVHMYRKLAEQVNKGERVFAVVGRNHVPLQLPALKCAIK